MAAKQKIGTVIRVADRTARIRVDRERTHRLYGKPYRISTSILADVPESITLGPGDTVTIEETRPVSKRKSWRIANVLEQASLVDAAAIREDDSADSEEAA